jgi:2-oxoglutarate dehydrogenase E2 component (dihydrolipoamide succinyltransferase)
MTAQVIEETDMTEIRVPTLGESVTEATIGRWFKKAGDAVAVDEPLVELETDKVTIEVPAPSAGTLGDIAAKDGETVAVGALLGQIGGSRRQACRRARQGRRATSASTALRCTGACRCRAKGAAGRRSAGAVGAQDLG